MVTVIIIQPRDKLSYHKGCFTHTHTHTQTTAEASPLLNSDNNIRQREKERERLLFCTPHALCGPAAGGALNRRGECCYGDRFHL